MSISPSPSYSITLRLEIVNTIGMFGKVATATVIFSRFVADRPKSRR